ncbi:hypothetical protein FRC08_002079, partial [Ceratobasidium sp. 394]
MNTQVNTPKALPAEARTTEATMITATFPRKTATVAMRLTAQDALTTATVPTDTAALTATTVQPMIDTFTRTTLHISPLNQCWSPTGTTLTCLDTGPAAGTPPAPGGALQTTGGPAYLDTITDACGLQPPWADPTPPILVTLAVPITMSTVLME